MIDLVKREPIRVLAAIQATLAAAVMFGVDVTEEQLSGIVIALSAWLALVTRSQVTPTPEDV